MNYYLLSEATEVNIEDNIIVDVISHCFGVTVVNIRKVQQV